MSSARTNPIGCSNGTYAAFGGGNTTGYSPSGDSTTVDFIDENLTRVAIGNMHSAVSQPASASAGELIIFAGGFGTDWSSCSIVSAFDGNLTAMPITYLAEPKDGIGSVGLGDYAIFAGGEDYDDYAMSGTPKSSVDLFDANLVRTAGTPISKARHRIAAAAVGDCAIFAGGTADSYNYGGLTDVDAYVLA